jgi:hypothetical protein
MKEAAAPITTQAASEETQRNFTARSTSVEAQRARIIAALRQRPHTSYELRRLGAFQAPARILELRYMLGYDIRTERVTLYDRDGYMHPNAARYHLDGEPLEGFTPSQNTGAVNALREAAKAIRAQAKGLERDSIKREHIPNVRQRLIDALRVLSALEREYPEQYARAREGSPDAGTDA